MPVSKKSSEEARCNGRKGGIASGEAKRKKKQLREALIALLDTKVPVKMPDGTKKDVDAREGISLALIRAALAGDVRAFATIRDTIGELPTQNVDVTSKGQSVAQRPQIVFKAAKEIVTEPKNEE